MKSHGQICLSMMQSIFLPQGGLVSHITIDMIYDFFLIESIRLIKISLILLPDLRYILEEKRMGLH